MCPNISLLKSYKFYPKLHEFSYMREKYFVYIYLNPFKEYDRPYTFKVNGEEFCTMYEPIYVGKGTGGRGYRHNQHIKSFTSNKEQNSIKVKWFKYIEDEMKKAKENNNINKPWNWDEYKKGWVIVAKTFNNATDLLKFEVTMIQELGTRWDATGPLTNKIKNSTII